MHYASKWVHVLGSGVPTGTFINAGQTIYAALDGWAYFDTIESNYQYLARANYTLRNLYLKVITNTLTVPFTLRVRVNGANGNLLITVPAGGTGVFQDVTHSDIINSGDTVGYQASAAAGVGFADWSLISCVSESAENISIIGGNYTNSIGFGTTSFFGFLGRPNFSATEAPTQYTVRTPATVSKLRLYVSANTCDGNLVIRLRKNGANGNSIITVLAGTTGWFEDTVNTDSLVAGDKISFQFITGGTVGTVGVNGPLHFNYESLSKIVSCGFTGTTIGGASFLPLTSDIDYSTATESNCRLPLRIPVRKIKHLFVVCSNSLTDTTIRSRRNGQDGNLVIVIPAAGSGIFEDITHEDADILETEDYNFSISGQRQFFYIGIEMLYSTPLGRTMPIPRGRI